MESLNRQLAVGSPLHRKILDAVIERKRFSETKMSGNWERFRKIDERMVGYIPKSEADTTRQNRRENKGLVDYVTLEVPYSYATVASMHTYITSVFLSRTPIFQMSARHGEGQDSILALESVLDYQVRVGMHLPILYNWLWDACKYGVGVIGEYWDEEISRSSRIIEREKTFLGIRTGKMEKVKETYELIGYQGNKLYPIRMYDFFPDPRLPISQFQDGEFCGRQVSVGLSQVEEGGYSGRYINVDVVSRAKGNKADMLEIASAAASSFSTQSDLTPGARSVDSPLSLSGFSFPSAGKDFVHLLEMVIRIVPKAWGLGEGTKCEKWVFTVANEAVVIGARPLGLYHDRFPYTVLETGFGSEDFIKPATLDHISPLNDAMTWLFNTHMWNVRKAINDVRIVDPSKIVMKDLEKPQPGGVIRLKPQFFGGDVRTAVMQLPAVDVTRQHLQDSQVIEQLIQRVSGVTDNIMGLVHDGGRKTATEVRTASGFSANRMKTIAEYFSAIGFSPLSQRLVSNTQQLMTEERKFAIAGGMANEAQRFIQASPETIAGFYDFVPVDGTLPIDRLAQANFWKELLVQLVRVPQLAQQWDFGAMIAHTMALQGERNVNRFKIQVAPPGMAPGGMVPGGVMQVGGQGGLNGPAGPASPSTGAGGATPLIG